MNGLALSTMWGIGRFRDLEDFFAAGESLGFARFELNHGVDSPMLSGTHLNRHRITSVHEPCPADISLTHLKERNWLISALDEENRQQGVAAVRRSIDLAHRIGARAVVVHPGRVDIDPALEPKLLNLYHNGYSDLEESVQARERLLAARAAQAQDNMQSVRRSLLELAEYAFRRDVRLGLENRYHYQEIPLPDELDELLDLGCGTTVGYWHDTGHAQVLQHLGFGTHQEWLHRFAGRMVGVHLHDAVGLRDHLAAGLGLVDWDMVAGYLPASALLTCEFHSANSGRQVVAGLRRLAEMKLGGGSYQ